MKMLKPRIAMLRTNIARPMQTERLHGNTWMKIRKRILTRDNGLCKCTKCAESGRLLVAHEVDHVVPLWQGGSNDDSNLAAINGECHMRKSALEAAARAG